jgi:hypothetical protein
MQNQMKKDIEPDKVQNDSSGYLFLVLTILIPAFLLFSNHIAAQKIYIVTDLEGASGVYKPSQCWDAKDTPLYEQA